MGVATPRTPICPPLRRVLEEAGLAGYTAAIELGPYGYLPMDAETVSAELRKNGIAIVAGTIFHDLLDPGNQENVLKAVDDICRSSQTRPCQRLPAHQGQKFPTPYMTVMDWGHDERELRRAAIPTGAPPFRGEWSGLMKNLRLVCERANRYGVGPVIHPHAGGYIEFEDEIAGGVRDYSL